VQAAGVNFRDVLTVMGLLGTGVDARARIGFECAGVVTATGPGVGHLRPGERVLAFHPQGGSFGSFVTLPATAVAAIPDQLAPVAAAGIPAVFLTAWYALRHVARVQPGERVLMMDSRSLDFAAQVREATGGEGVDVVLNSLAGPAIRAGLETLRPFGRFIELGVRDILADAPLGMLALRHNITLAAVDLLELQRTRPEFFAGLLGELIGMFADGRRHRGGRLRRRVHPAARRHVRVHLRAADQGHAGRPGAVHRRRHPNLPGGAVILPTSLPHPRDRAWWRHRHWSQRAAWPGGFGRARAAASSFLTSGTVSGARPGSAGGGIPGSAGGAAWVPARSLSRAAVTAQTARAASRGKLRVRQKLLRPRPVPGPALHRDPAAHRAGRTAARSG